MWVKESISGFFPVLRPTIESPAVTLLGRNFWASSETLDVSLTQEESIVPEHLIQQKLEICSFVSFIDNICFGTYHSVGLLRNRLELWVAYFSAI